MHFVAIVLHFEVIFCVFAFYNIKTYDSAYESKSVSNFRVSHTTKLVLVGSTNHFPIGEVLKERVRLITDQNIVKFSSFRSLKLG